MSKLCFAHAPNTTNPSVPIKFLPIGLPAIADYLERRGFDCEIVHLGLERTLAPGWSLADHVRREGIGVVLFDLHWHQQSYDVVKEARALKRAVPGVTVVAGGFTASYFALELMRFCREIDFVVRGHPEVPLERLMKEVGAGRGAVEAGGRAPRPLSGGALAGRGRWAGIPNLCWRRRAGVVANPQSYVAPSALLDGLRFSSLGLVRHGKEYLRLMSDHEDVRLPHEGDLLCYYNPGRGCSADCSFCGGARSAQDAISRQPRPVFFDRRSVVRDLRAFAGQGVSRVHMCFDVAPRQDYFVELFREVRRRRVRLALTFEAYAPPSDLLLDEMRAAFGAPIVILSPESGSETVRRRNKSFHYSNADLLAALRRIERRGLAARLYFTAGLPHEGPRDVLETLSLIGRVRKEFPSVGVFSYPISIEPGAPRHVRPREHDTRCALRGFAEFYEFHRRGGQLGYRTGRFSESEILSLVGLYRAAAV
ncbi:MAG: radical SAM protein [Elusimicrobia bacterium]|nr:radical SAM protein [Elusimicrobiota bacterium]